MQSSAAIKTDPRFKVTMLSSTTSVLRVMSNGQLDAAMLTLDEAIKFQSETGLPLCIPLVIDYSDGADALLVNAQTFHLKGPEKVKIGYESTATGGYMLRRSLDFLAITANAINAIPLHPNEHLDAFRSGAVDGIITFEPYLSKIHKAGGVIRFSSSDIPGEIIDVLVVRQQVWNSRQESVNLLIDDLFRKGVAIITAGEAEVISAISQNLKSDGNAIANALKGIHFPTAAENRAFIKETLPSVVNHISNYLIEEKIIAKPSTLGACQ
ncbi:MAG: ABC transporter substrate-binding protein [Gammaproteobacteria bacterium]|nr:ABC transporter substrate-binding protein [Gammaproteobacteria bacterium]